MGWLYILLTIVLTVYGQIVIKWQISRTPELAPSAGLKLTTLLRLFLNPIVLSAFAAALLASLAWMAALSRLNLSFAYPFMSLSFVLVLLLSATLFREPLTAYKMLGMALIVLGLFVSSRSR